MSTFQAPLSKGHVAIVDAEDAERVCAFKWSAHETARSVYAYRNVYRSDGSRTTQRLHQFITGYAITDHINGDGLDNRRVNLREATKRQNNQNRRLGLDNSSGYKGVTWHKRNLKWQARIHTDGRRVSLGLYLAPEEAARAYDAAARELHGEFAALNFPTSQERAA